jgi:hypothetical protein
MSMPIVLKGIIKGDTIELPGRIGLPDGYQVTLHLILTPEEAMELSFGAWKDMTPEEVAEYEQILSEIEGQPVQLPAPDPS